MTASSPPPEPPDQLPAKAPAGLAVAPGFVRLMGIPAVLWIPSAFGFGILQKVVDRPWARSLFETVQFVALPIACAVCSALLAVHFRRDRSAGSLTRRSRSDHRFVLFLLTLFAATGLQRGFWFPLAVCLGALALVMVRTRISVRTAGAGRRD